MDDQLDLAIALSLQEKFDKEAKTEHKKKLTKVQKEWDDTKVDPRSIVDSQLELTDPNPNIHELFVQYDAMFFWSKLVSNGVAVRWSPRMTLCAGVCAYEGRGGLCSIRLSQPLLKLRPRKDLVQTLLHEMIHAYLFVTENYRDHDGHGPKFLSHMNRINGMTGANISVYHSFHDEVREYRQHWWKCNGPCQFRPPYFGIVKRAMNRAPSSRDPWWSQHKASCGGTYEKIKEPENYGKNKTKQQSSGKKKTVKSKNIKDMFDKKDVDGGSRKAGASVGDSSGVKPFEGSGHRLVDKDKTEVGGDKLSLREKMLLAAEKRHLEAQRRGSSSQSGVVHQKRPRDKISPPCSHHQSESISSDDLHPSVKRPKITSDNSVIVIDPDSPQATTNRFQL